MAASPAPKRKTPAKQPKRPMLPDRQAMESYAASHTQAEIDAALHDAQNLIYDA